MAQDDYIISDQAGVAFLSDLNSQFAAAVTNNSGATEPAVKYAHMWWADTTAGLMKQRNTANNSWITRGSLTSAIIPGFESTGIDDNAASTAVTIDSLGNVGIGTSSIDFTSTGRTVVHVEGSAGALLALEDTGAKSYLFQTGNDLLIENDTSTGSMIFGTGSSIERMRIDSLGRLLVGSSTAPDYDGTLAYFYNSGNNAAVFRANTASNCAVFQTGNGSNTGQSINFRHGAASVGTIVTTGSSTSYNTSSDYRLKENMNVIEDDFILGVMGGIPVYTGNFITDPDETLGMYKAQEVYEQLPNVTSGTPDETEEYELTPAVLDSDGVEVTPAVMGTRPRYMGMDHSKIVPYLHAYTQALHRMIIKELEERS